ncbi:hypothetical protein AAG747_19610 [Rapidithrix thailandica]|uniref:Uncharacterized protein n=1 Tax=Rapidithrix thailandica TaxID=413964 RepID=A0AAW9SH16_9BACT
MMHQNEMQYQQKLDLLFQRAFANASEAFRLFTGKPVQGGTPQYFFDKRSYIEEANQKTFHKHCLLVTKLIGEIEGRSFLLIPKQGCRELYTPLSDFKKEHVMLEFAKELDNILSAAVITEITNILQLNLHGGVPDLNILSKLVIETFIEGFSSGNQDFFVSTTFLVGNPSQQFQTQFLWQFSENFLAKIANTPLLSFN